MIGIFLNSIYWRHDTDNQCNSWILNKNSFSWWS